MLETYLEKYFGYKEFRQGQKEIITNILQNNNVLGVLPTGAGKSICYQLPSLLSSGVTIVVSPLLSLMEDQVYQLKLKGFDLATYINSQISYKEADKRLSLLQRGKYKILYLSPEKLQQTFFVNKIKKLNISLFVVDEAHCISQWGHDFRIDYLRLRDTISHLNNPKVLALTATATPEVQDDIIKQLDLDKVEKTVTSIDRTNIAYDVIKIKKNEDKKEILLNLVNRLYGSGIGIIYTQTRQQSEQITDELKQVGIKYIEAYHAGLASDDRMIIQQQFMKEELSIIVATKAFGMGINKDNVRYVIHYDMPDSLESFTQETGRAGRDGEQSYAALIYSNGDEEKPLLYIDSEYPTIKQIRMLVETLYLSTIENVKLQVDELQLLQMNNQQLELALFQLEKQGFIHWEKKETYYQITKIKIENPKNFDLEYIHQYFVERKQKRKQDLLKMHNFVNGNRCRREQILYHFKQSKKNTIDNCCDICGLSREDLLKQKHLNYKIKDFNWENELRELFHYGGYNEEKN